MRPGYTSSLKGTAARGPSPPAHPLSSPTGKQTIQQPVSVHGFQSSAWLRQVQLLIAVVVYWQSHLASLGSSLLLCHTANVGPCRHEAFALLRLMLL